MTDRYDKEFNEEANMILSEAEKPKAKTMDELIKENEYLKKERDRLLKDIVTMMEAPAEKELAKEGNCSICSEDKPASDIYELQNDYKMINICIDCLNSNKHLGKK